MTNEQAHLIDRGWKMVEIHGRFLYIDPADGFACSRELAVTLQRQRDEARAQGWPVES
jgi:hypothetical protein